MKKSSNTTIAGKRAPLWPILLLVVSFFVACTDNILTPDPVRPNDGDARVTLKVNTPQTTLPTAIARTQSEAETHISELKVLVFEKDDNEYIFSYQASGATSSGSGQQTEFNTTLITTNKSLKLVVLANSNHAFQSYVPQYGATEEAVRQNLNATFSSAGMTGALPMYGEILLPDGVDASQTYTLPITVLRAIARVDVVKELVDGAPTFILEEVYAFRTNDKIQLIPDNINNPSSPKVSAPSVPNDAVFVGSPVEIISNGGVESITQLYVPEAKAAASQADRIKGVTSIIIGGRYGGEDSPVTYYRADFNSGIEGHPFGQILRNHRYIFAIKKVSAAGWGSPDEAANNLSSSIIVDVQTWEDFSSEMYFGEDRFAISARKISLRYIKDREARLDVESTLAYKIQWLDTNGNPTGDATSSQDVTISNDNFDVTIVQDAEDGEYISHLVFRTRNQNHLGDIIKSQLRITAGNWVADITVSQDNSAMYSNRYMNILSVETIGNLGENLVSNGASGMAMRKVLDVQFAPNGVIRIGGSSFTRIPNTSAYVGTSAADNLALMKRIIGSQDVIYFPYNVSISAAVADLLLEWVSSNPRRVLIIGADTSGTNAALLNKLTEDGTWNFSNISSVTNKYARGKVADGTEDFFEGPFGEIAENASFNRADGIAGYSNNYPVGAVLNLISSDMPGNEGYMFLGVNKEKRIIYNGDAQLFLSSQMSNNNGNVTSDLDKLMANTWAWITEQVIYGSN